MPHGIANAVLLPFVEKYNLMVAPERFAEIAVAMGENIDGLGKMAAAEKCIDAIVRLSQDVGIPQSLGEMGVKESDLQNLSEMALRDGNAGTNPRIGNVKDVLELFKSAM
jgi:1,3-propanediol dehydrogenase